MKSQLIGRDSDAGRDWGQEEKGLTKDKMAGWHHQLTVHLKLGPSVSLFTKLEYNGHPLSPPFTV